MSFFNLSSNFALHPNVLYFIILLFLMPHNFSCKGESAGTQWVVHLNQTMFNVVYLKTPDPDEQKGSA